MTESQGYLEHRHTQPDQPTPSDNLREGVEALCSEIEDAIEDENLNPRVGTAMTRLTGVIRLRAKRILALISPTEGQSAAWRVAACFGGEIGALRCWEALPGRGRFHVLPPSPSLTEEEREGLHSVLSASGLSTARNPQWNYPNIGYGTLYIERLLNEGSGK